MSESGPPQYVPPVPPPEPSGSSGPAPGPGPYQQLAAARRTARSARWLATAALAVAVVAVVLSMAALANGRRDTAGSAAGATTSAERTQDAERPAPTSQPTRGTGSSRSTPVDTARVRPEADFKLEYERQALHVLPQGECDEYRYVDLDEPRVGVSRSTAEFGYGTPCGGGKPHIDVVDELPISTANENAIARDCAEAIRNGPINEPLVPTDQASLCLLTSAETAEAEGVSRKLVLITVETVGPDGGMNLLVTAWSVPT